MSKTKKKLTKGQKLKKIRSNFELWCLNFIKIVDNRGDVISFKLNAQQKHLFQNMDKYNIILKSRQLGFTTYSIAYCLYVACTQPNTTSLILSYNIESTQETFERLKFMYNNMPEEYKPKEIRNNKYELMLEFPDKSISRVVVKVAGKKPLGRGFTCQYIHCSELAFWGDFAATKGLMGLEQSLAKNMDSKIVIESTANGFNSYWELYTNAKKGNSKYKAFFFPFWQNRNQFRDEYDIAEKWYYDTNKGERLSKDTCFGYHKELLDLGANLRQIMWYDWKLQDMSTEEMYQEYPATEEQAFVSTQKSVFDSSIVLERYNNLMPPFKENELQVELPKLLKQFFGKSLFIYKNIKADVRCYGGVDCAGGTGADYSSISIYDNDGEQVCSFYNNKIPLYRFARVIDVLGKYFNYAFLAVERNSYGLPLIERLRNDYGYLNLYKQKVFNQYGRRKLQLGFLTTNTTKSILIADFKEQFEVGLININCKQTLEEMQIFVEDKGKLGNERKTGYTDDNVIANALAIQAMKTGKYYVSLGG